MKRFVLCLSLLLFAIPVASLADDAKKYKEGQVVTVSSIKTKPGKFNDYMAYLAGPYKKLMEERKKAGLITGYAVYGTDPRSPADPDVFLVTFFPNMAALDKIDEDDALAAKVMGSMQAQDKAFADRESIRQVLGNQLMRELVLK